MRACPTIPVTILVLAGALAAVAWPSPQLPVAVDNELPLAGDAAVHFLSAAAVVQLERFDSPGITAPRRATLRDGERTARAVFKDFHETRAVKTVRGGERITRFRDSYLHEAAAYELSEMLGLGLVPPTVIRRIERVEGALQLWIEGAMSEVQRLEEGLAPVDPVAWSRQMTSLGVFLQLISDTDYRNLNNILVTRDFRVYKIDSSRAFRVQHRLRDPGALNRFSRRFLARLRALDPDELAERMAPYLEAGQVQALLARREAILELAERRIAERGEAAALCP